jgi:predicted MPP superfamily phosphohydrolase
MLNTERLASSQGLGDDIPESLQQRVGRLYARQRLGMERDQEADVAAQEVKLLRMESAPSAHLAIRAAVVMSGLYRRGLRNSARVELSHNHIDSPRLPPSFDGVTILQLSDLHVDMSADAMERVVQLVEEVAYDLCVLTGDYRARILGPLDSILAGVARVRASITGTMYAVLGNYDSLRMVPAFEQMGIRTLLNECETIERGDQRIHLAGIDDAHFFRLDNITKAAAAIPHDEFSILISHTPEIYRQAAHAGFKVLIAGHTHGGQICLPGGIPMKLGAALPRSMGAGSWSYRGMAGYTSRGAGSSVVPVRFNCPPEITLHHLRRSP